MELQAALAEYERNDIAVFAVSYDSVAVLQGFSEKYSIQYPLLADEGSVVIKRLGMLNERLAEHHGFYGGQVRDDQWGVPYPGTFILDADGVIVQKRFEDSYRERETAVGVLEAAFGARSSLHGAEAQAATEGVAVRAYLDSPTYRSMQRLRLTVDVQMGDGLHIYGNPTPDGYVPLSVEVAPVDGLVAGALEGPPPHPFTVDGLDEEFYVYDDGVTVTMPLTFHKAAGDLVLDVTIRYQACSATECKMPATVRFQLPVSVLNHVERPG